MDRISRRSFFKGAAAAAAAAAVAPGCERAPEDISGQRRPYSFFDADEASFIEAAVARLIPEDETGPGALEAAVPTYIDRQLAGAWGAGERLYRSGPWQLRVGTSNLGDARDPVSESELGDSQYYRLPARRFDVSLRRSF